MITMKSLDKLWEKIIKVKLLLQHLPNYIHFPQTYDNDGCKVLLLGIFSIHKKMFS